MASLNKVKQAIQVGYSVQYKKEDNKLYIAYIKEILPKYCIAKDITSKPFYLFYSDIVAFTVEEERGESIL